MKEKFNGEADEVSGVQVVDERTVRITIDEPKEYFLAKLTYPSAAVVDRNTVEPLGFDWWMSDDINGSGPYRLLRWEEEEVVILQRFDDFHTPASGGVRRLSADCTARELAAWGPTFREPGMPSPSASVRSMRYARARN